MILLSGCAIAPCAGRNATRPWQVDQAWGSKMMQNVTTPTIEEKIMPNATWNQTVIAEAATSDIVIVENNLYFPRSAVNSAHLRASTHQTICPWKGTAHYFDVVVGDAVNANAAWYYPAPKDAAKEIAGRIAFWKGVTVTR
jgi:uncharacterized protein (DUF427 family)